ncbi:MAG: hypothetical protein IJU70_07755 [Lentisphaeria bacterium]|nr:hypothetical protein [Lentisphaeria bacterium]
METVLVIPLYIAFLSGIYLLGDLVLGRSRLTAGDRLAVWDAGCRHLNKGDSAVKKSVSQVLFGRGEFAEGTELASFSSGKTGSGFFAVVSGTAKLKMVLPDWAVLCRKGALVCFAEIGNGPRNEMWDKVSFTARKVDSGRTHTVLMRRRYDERDKAASVLAVGGPRWHREYRQPYVNEKGALNDRPGAYFACEGSRYERLAQYVNWSR